MNGYNCVQRDGFHNVIITNMSSSHDGGALAVKNRLMNNTKIELMKPQLHMKGVLKHKWQLKTWILWFSNYIII